MNEFVASNGIGVRWLDKVFGPGFKFSGKPKHGRTDEGWIQLLDEHYLTALREFFQHEHEEELRRCPDKGHNAHIGASFAHPEFDHV